MAGAKSNPLALVCGDDDFAVKQRDEPGRAPAKPEIDTTRPHEYVYMIRDLGAKRKPAGFITVGNDRTDRWTALPLLMHTRQLLGTILRISRDA